MTLFWYFFKEIIPQFVTALCVLSAVIVVSQLIRLADVLVTFGITLENVLLPFLFIMLPFLAFIIPIAFLFAVLLSFGRLSADGEYTAMLASGYSLRKAARPVLIISTVLYFLTILCAMYFEPWGRREMVSFYHRKTQTELDNMIRVQMKSGVFLDNFLGYVLYAEKISPDRTRFDNVLLAPGVAQGKQNFSLLAPSASITGSVESGDLKMAFDYGVLYSTTPEQSQVSVVKFKRAELDLLRIFKEQIFGPDSSKDDYRNLSPGELWTYIGEIKKDDTADGRDTYYKARFLFHQRLGMPFAVMTFALFGMVLGIGDERRGKSTGYIGAILTVIVGYIVMMGFKYLAEKGQVSAPLAAWIPNILLAAFGMFLVYQKNRLPPSEGTLDPKNIPYVNHFWNRKSTP